MIKMIDKSATKEKIKEVKLIYASLISNTLLTEEFFKTHIVDKAGGSLSSKEKAKNLNKNLFGFIGSAKTPTPGGLQGDENVLGLKNRVLIGVFGTNLFILKERWAHWRQVSDGNILKRMKI